MTETMAHQSCVDLLRNLKRAESKGSPWAEVMARDHTLEEFADGAVRHNMSGHKLDRGNERADTSDGNCGAKLQ